MKKATIKKEGISKRSKISRKKFELPEREGISPKLMRKIHEALVSYKNQINRYLEVKDNAEELNIFCSMLRNPLFDITGTKFFDTGLVSVGSTKCERCETSKDHLIQRTKALQYIFRDLAKNPNLDIDTFIDLLIKYCSTVYLTKDEHRMVTTYGRNNPHLTNVKIYNKLKIKVIGLGSWCKKMYVTRVTERSF